jgi:DNA-binding SARP family transcriptional activator
LVEAYAIWRDGGAGPDSDRVLRALGCLAGATAEDRVNALLAAQRLAPRADNPAPADDEPAGPPVQVRVLGRFEVLVAGRLVPAAAWQSRKARDLLRILVARRGRPVPRPELSELLWPDDDPGRTGHRLSVLLSIVRQVLDPDRRAPGDGLVVADGAGLALDTGRLLIDVEVFLADVAYARSLRRRGDAAAARTLLGAAVAGYTGDAFADDPYSDWTAPLREEARATYLRALCDLAADCRAAGDVEEAIGHLRRILAEDPYDEAAHRDIVTAYATAGRHGEARRAHRRYVTAMDAIGVTAAPAAVISAAPAAVAEPHRRLG